jgi:purine nucleosidase
MRQTIRARPGEVHLLSVGPMTNVALLFAVDPEVPTLLAGYTVMGGQYLAGPALTSEWNVWCDPEAAAIVAQRAAHGTRFVGTDVTVRCRLDAAEVRRRFAAAGGPLDVVSKMAELWFEGRDDITFHDPLAAAVVFEPDLCRWQRGAIAVALESDARVGLSSFAPSPSGPFHVAVDVDPNRFFEHYFAVVGG